MKIYNSLQKKIEEFVPINPRDVHMYACGPTVYQRAHIGNFRTYTVVDLLHRILIANDYGVNYIMNITDVGHLTGDNEGDASSGEDRMEAAAKKSSQSIWNIANHFTELFINDYKLLSLLPPNNFVRATDHIKDQIELISELEKKGYTYKTSDGIYFDILKSPHYGKLSTLDSIKAGARVKINKEKKNERDFALWKFSPRNEKRQMEWDSPWGIGFPGWHIECSAMSLKYLGPTLDIHCGGEDLRSTHHPNEIAQSEAATGKLFARFWVHVSFMLVDSRKMSKSLGNTYTIDQIKEKGFDPSVLKYFYYTGHYRKQINLTETALEGARVALLKLRNIIQEATEISDSNLSEPYYKKFLEIISDDLNSPEAIAYIWSVAKDDTLSQNQKAAIIIKCNEVLGLELITNDHIEDLPQQIKDLAQSRIEARRKKSWPASDKLRNQIEKLGYIVSDSDQGQLIKRKQ